MASPEAFPPVDEGTSSVFSQTQIRHLMRVEFSRAQRYVYPVTCCVVACDRVEELRDRHGYELKEAVLDEVTELVVRSTRGCDYIGRLLDDRLLAILPHTDRAGAEIAAGRLLDFARRLRLGSREGLSVTLSIGLATYSDENTMFFDSLVQTAEEALAQALREGGDRAVYGTPGPGAASG